MTDWMTKRRFFAVAFTLVVLQLLFRWWWASGGYFWQDDFQYLAEAAKGLTVDRLLQDYNGHLLPGSFAVSRLVVALGSSYGVALAIILALQAIASLLLIWVVDLLFPRRLLSLVVLAATMFTPLTLVGVSWYAFGLQLWPVQIAMLACTGGYLRWRATRGGHWLALVVVGYAVGLFFWEKALLIPGVLVLLAVLVLDRRHGFGERLKNVLREWELWLPMIALTIGYVAIYLSHTASIGGEGETAQKSVDIGTFIGTGLMQTLMPGLLGGPWTSAGSLFTLSATPPLIATVLAVLVWACLFGASLVRHGWRGAQAWIWIGAVVAIDYGLLIAFRPTAELGARDSRYIADAIPVIALGVLAALLSPLGEPAGETPPTSSARSRWTERIGSLFKTWPRRASLAGAAALVILIGAAGTSLALGDGMRNTTSRAYVTNLQKSIESDPGLLLLNSKAPFPAVYFGTLKELDQALGLGANFVDAGQDMRMFDAGGRPHEVGVKDASLEQKGPREGCGWLLQPENPVELKTGQKPIAWPHRVLQIGYFGKKPHTVSVTIDGKKRAALPAADGLGVLTVRVPRMPQEIRLTVDAPGASLCITDITVGIATPKTS